MVTHEEEWLWGWDETPGIVSVWAETDGRTFVWRRVPETRELLREDVRFRPWFVLAVLEDLAHLGKRLVPEQGGALPLFVTYEELTGPGALYLVRANVRASWLAILRGAAGACGDRSHLRELSETGAGAAAEEQCLVASGQAYFRHLLR